jgi:hypothetical protein
MSDGPVKPCTNVGYPGTKVVLPSPLPANLICTLMGYVQAASTITVSVISDTTGKTVASINGTGTSPTAMTPSIVTFNTGNDTFYVTVASTSNDTPSVILQDLVLSYGSAAYAGAYVLIAEDTPQTGDCDFNDCTCYLTWNLLSG